MCCDFSREKQRNSDFSTKQNKQLKFNLVFDFIGLMIFTVE